MAGPRVTLRDVRFAYPNERFRLAIDDAAFGPGVHGLLGPNGAGKTTLMKLLVGLLDARSGRLMLGDAAITPKATHVRRRIALMPQDFGLFAGFDAGGGLRYYAGLHGFSAAQARQRVDEVVALLELEDLLPVDGDQLSGGQRQRVGLAMALLTKPELLLVDEPTAGLDPVERERVLRVLHAYGQTNTVLLSTHIVEDVGECCARAAIMLDGTLVASGSVGELADRLAGKLWTRAIDSPAAAPAGRVRLREGALVEWRVADDRPEGAWRPAAASLRATFVDLMARARDGEADGPS
ncbi:MAG: ABC transporter ATP-binding protein [Myxococcota bacterium]